MWRLLALSGLLVCFLTQSEAQDFCGCPPEGSGSYDDDYGKLFQGVVPAMNKSSGLPNGAKKIGDMILLKKDFDIRSGKNKFRNSQKNREWLWPKGEVPYFFDENYPKHLLQPVRRELEEFNQAMQGCVRFRELRGAPGGTYAIRVTASGYGCGSLVGRIGMAEGFQDLNLDEACVKSRGTTKHEFMHALGFEHEQSRPDRDQHLEITWSNIMHGACSQFDICKGCLTDTPFDIKSIMQYDSEAFTCNYQQTMSSKSGEKIARNEVLTALDKKKIRILYSCR